MNGTWVKVKKLFDQWRAPSSAPPLHLSYFLPRHPPHNTTGTLPTTTETRNDGGGSTNPVAPYLSPASEQRQLQHWCMESRAELLGQLMNWSHAALLIIHASDNVRTLLLSELRSFGGTAPGLGVVQDADWIRRDLRGAENHLHSNCSFGRGNQNTDKLLTGPNVGGDSARCSICVGRQPH